MKCPVTHVASCFNAHAHRSLRSVFGTPPPRVRTPRTPSPPSSKKGPVCCLPCAQVPTAAPQVVPVQVTVGAGTEVYLCVCVWGGGGRGGTMRWWCHFTPSVTVNTQALPQCNLSWDDVMVGAGTEVYLRGMWGDVRGCVGPMGGGTLSGSCSTM
jgi:hypothetical protein